MDMRYDNIKKRCAIEGLSEFEEPCKGTRSEGPLLPGRRRLGSWFKKEEFE